MKLNDLDYSIIADRVNDEFQLAAHKVTTEQVASLAKGEGIAESHPVHAAILREIKNYKK